jgi:uncharacterized membrane protein
MMTRWRALPEFTSLALVVGTAAIGVLLAPALPEQMIVGWHLGLDGHVSVTRGPRLLGLALLPIITAGVYVLLRAIRLLLDAEASQNTRGFEILDHLLLSMLVLAQAWLLSLNMQ